MQASAVPPTPAPAPAFAFAMPASSIIVHSSITRCKKTTRVRSLMARLLRRGTLFKIKLLLKLPSELLI
jgi:hypothetical protein